MGFWSGYWSSMKSLDVEEPVDAYGHRVIGYVLAKLGYRTPISPDQITIASILLGLASGVLFAVPVRHHLQIGAACLVLSAGFDCADGMLARMRGTSSAFGRMLDGMADLITLGAAIAGSCVLLISMYWATWWHAAIVAAFAGATIFTSSFHTTGYDHYKNVYMRFTVPGSREGEDVDAAIARFERARHEPMGPFTKVTFFVYLNYLKAQRDWVVRFDPQTTVRLDEIPAHDEARAAIYRKYAGPPMRLWRWFFGTGSMIFGLAIFNAFGRPDLYMIYRFVFLNGIFHLWLKPLQRRASRRALRALEEMGLAPGGAA